MLTHDKQPIWEVKDDEEETCDVCGRELARGEMVTRGLWPLWPDVLVCEICRPLRPFYVQGSPNEELLTKIVVSDHCELNVEHHHDGTLHLRLQNRRGNWHEVLIGSDNAGDLATALLELAVVLTEASGHALEHGLDYENGAALRSRPKLLDQHSHDHERGAMKTASNGPNRCKPLQRHGNGQERETMNTAADGPNRQKPSITLKKTTVREGYGTARGGSDRAPCPGTIGSRADTLTRRQREVILAIVNHQIQHQGRSPSVRELRDALGLTSTSTVFTHLWNLEKKGYITTESFTARSIHLV